MCPHCKFDKIIPTHSNILDKSTFIEIELCPECKNWCTIQNVSNNTVIIGYPNITLDKGCSCPLLRSVISHSPELIAAFQKGWIITLDF